MRIEIDSGGFTSACDAFYRANHGIVDGVAALSGALGGGSAMAGSDSGGRDWADQYDQAAAELLSLGADLGAAMASMANLLNAALVSHEGADFGARLSGPPVGGFDDGDPNPDHYTERLSPAKPPSAFGGSADQPDGWHWIAEHLQGLLWPDADTSRLRSIGQSWTRAGQTVSGYAGHPASAGAQIAAQRSAEVADAVSACTSLQDATEQIAQAYGEVGKACADYADHVDTHRQEVISALEELLAWTVVDQATGAVLAFFTAGASELAAQLAEAGIIARYASRIITILRRLIELARLVAATIATAMAKLAGLAVRLGTVVKARVVAASLRAAERIGLDGVLRLLPEGVQAKTFLGSAKTLRDGLAAKGIRGELLVQGSRAARTAHAGSDIDYAVRVTESEFREYVARCFGNPNPGSAKWRTMQHALETGKIQAGEAKLSGLRRALEEQLGMDVDLSIVLKGGKFDSPPYVKVP